MNREFTALLFLIAVAGSTFSKAIALLDYRLNKEFIASTLCENKDRPACCCKGKCFLKKQLQKEESSKNNPSSIKEKSDIVLYLEDELKKSTASIETNILYPDYLEKKYSGSSSSIFHPPTQA